MTTDQIDELLILNTWLDPTDPESHEIWTRLTARRDTYAVLRTINSVEELGYTRDDLMEHARIVAAWIDNPDDIGKEP